MSELPLGFGLSTDFFQGADGDVDIFLCIEDPEAEANRAGRECAESFMCGRCAVKSHARHDAVVEIEFKSGIRAVYLKCLN